MDQETNQSVEAPDGVEVNRNVEADQGAEADHGRIAPDVPDARRSQPARPTSRRRFLRYGLCGLACVGAGGAGAYYLARRGSSPVAAIADAVESITGGPSTTEVFKNDAPQGRIWDEWQERGWVREARHYLKLGRNVQCKLCPNECLLAPEDRSHCRNRVNKDGKLYTLTYGNACSLNLDPIEKKPLLHFLPRTDVFSFASSGCGFRCLNCQNWDISQRKPEESKDPSGEPLRLTPQRLATLTLRDLGRLSMFPEDVVSIAEYLGSPSIAYTYSEPTSWYEYMIDTARLARARGIKNVWVTCGYMQKEPLRELAPVLDAANVDLKSFSDEAYRTLNSGKLKPILNTLKTLKREGVWFEVTNLVVPTYTDKMDMVRRMCDWMLDDLGPDYPLHFSRFHPEHKLTHLPPTPIDVLLEARAIARECGLHYVYVGNVRGVKDAQTTFCPKCHEKVVERYGYDVDTVHLDGGQCALCGTRIAGVWSAGRQTG